MKLDPRLKNYLSYGFIGCGAMSIVSSIMGIVSAYVLVEASDEQAVGITPGDFVLTYATMILLGAGLVYFGFRLRK